MTIVDQPKLSKEPAPAILSSHQNQNEGSSTPSPPLVRLVKELKQQAADWPTSQLEAVYLLFDVCQALGYGEVEIARLLGRKAFRYLKAQGLFTIEEEEVTAKAIKSG
jgi:hypothetical protein